MQVESTAQWIGTCQEADGPNNLSLSCAPWAHFKKFYSASITKVLEEGLWFCGNDAVRWSLRPSGFLV